MARGRPSRIAIFDRFNTAVAELNGSVGGLPTPIEGEEIWEEIWVSWAAAAAWIGAEAFLRAPP